MCLRRRGARDVLQPGAMTGVVPTIEGTSTTSRRSGDGRAAPGGGPWSRVAPDSRGGGGSGGRPPIAGSEAPLRREQQELHGARSASIRAADRRAVCEDTPEGHDIGAAAPRADVLARVGARDLEHPITPILAHRSQVARDASDGSGPDRSHCPYVRRATSHT